MKQKNIIGLISRSETLGHKVAEQLLALGFFKLELNSKVKEFAKYLMKISGSDITPEIIKSIRERGYQVNRLYWVNLALASVPESKEKIFIPDLRMEDTVAKVITTYFVGNLEEKASCPKDIIFVERTEIAENYKDFAEKLAGSRFTRNVKA